MHYNLAAGTALYRVTGAGVVWPTPLLGLGAYHTKGGRYNYPAEPTIYCTEDALAVIAEAAFYQALEWQEKISRHRLRPVTYPLVSKHKLWSFSLDPSPHIIDLEHPQALALFQHTPHMLSNLSLNPAHGPHIPGQPLARDYLGTQDLAKDVRGHVPPSGSVDRRPEGIKAPAIRLKRVPGYRPHMLALFVLHPAVHTPYENRATQILECDLELQFLELGSRHPVTPQTIDIDWCTPQFRLSGSTAATIPPYSGRPGAASFAPNQWYDIEIQFG
jgi:hypothetical protein